MAFWLLQTAVDRARSEELTLAGQRHITPSSGLSATFSPEGEKGLRSRGEH
jgi:hypothetical protein